MGAITLTDGEGSRAVPLGDGDGAVEICTDLAHAVAAAHLVVVAVPATAHEDLAPRLVRLLTDGQVVLMPPGTFGSVLFGSAMAQADHRAEVAFAEAGTLPYLARRQGAEVVVSAYATRLPTGVFPERLSGRVYPVLRAAYPSIEECGDGLSGALMNAGPIIHPPLIMMNAGPLEHSDDWDIHNEGTQPAVRRVTDALDQERIALREALGYEGPHFPLADHYRPGGDEWMYGDSAHQRLVDSDGWREPVELTEHRYLQEDTRLGLSLLVSLGRWTAVPTPVAAGLLSIASALVGKDLYAQGRTLERLGLAGFTPGELQHFLQDGHRS